MGENRKPKHGVSASWMMVAVCIGILGLVVGFWGAVYALNRPTGVRHKEVTVEKGMTVAQIARKLYRERLIRSPELLRVFSLINGTSRRLTAGVHPFHGRMTTWQVLMELEVPRDVTQDVTLPEGLRLGQVADILADKLDLDEATFKRILTDSNFCHSLGIDAPNLEGYLFPETYRFSLTMTEEQVARMVVGHFEEIFDHKMKTRARAMGMTVGEVVTLASIVEGEAQLDEERPIVAAVYYNRLKKNMRLQADPTVQYAIPDGPRRLFYKDYRVDSPYNTYRHRGLPPGPIMSPGKASLVATLYPADVDYLYFVARGDGTHVFSQTPKEHEAAKRETLSARRRSWQKSNKKVK